jgi:hypothetical protein
MGLSPRRFLEQQPGSEVNIPIGWDIVLWVQPRTASDRARVGQCARQLMNLSRHVYARDRREFWAWFDRDPLTSDPSLWDKQDG